jgi:hypothetical protein
MQAFTDAFWVWKNIGLPKRWICKLLEAVWISGLGDNSVRRVCSSRQAEEYYHEKICCNYARAIGHH